MVVTATSTLRIQLVTQSYPGKGSQSVPNRSRTYALSYRGFAGARPLNWVLGISTLSAHNKTSSTLRLKGHLRVKKLSGLHPLSGELGSLA